LGSQVLVSNKNKQLSITSFASTIDKTIIYDAAGRRLPEKRWIARN
jgi:hypothetical protein